MRNIKNCLLNCHFLCWLHDKSYKDKQKDNGNDKQLTSWAKFLNAFGDLASKVKHVYCKTDKIKNPIGGIYHGNKNQ